MEKSAAEAIKEIKNGNLEKIQQLVTQDVGYYVDEDGRTMLHTAAKLGQLSIIKWLISNFPDLLNQGSDYNNTPLHLAAEGGKLAVMEYLVQQGADVNLTNNGCLTPTDILQKHHPELAPTWESIQGRSISP